MGRSPDTSGGLARPTKQQWPNTQVPPPSTDLYNTIIPTLDWLALTNLVIQLCSYYYPHLWSPAPSPMQTLLLSCDAITRFLPLPVWQLRGPSHLLFGCPSPPLSLPESPSETLVDGGPILMSWLLHSRPPSPLPLPVRHCHNSIPSPPRTIASALPATSLAYRLRGSPAKRRRLSSSPRR